MLRMSRLTDYATVLLAALAGEPGRVQTATSLAGQTHIAAPSMHSMARSPSPTAPSGTACARSSTAAVSGACGSA